MVCEEDVIRFNELVASPPKVEKNSLMTKTLKDDF
jgi:hypothetical protein